MKTTSKLLILASGALLFSINAFAMGGGMMKRPSFSDIDVNSDKQITKKEFKDFGEKMANQRENSNRPKNPPKRPEFSDVDTNSDGVISESEFKTMQENHRKGRGQNGRGDGKGGGKRANF